MMYDMRLLGRARSLTKSDWHPTLLHGRISLDASGYLNDRNLHRLPALAHQDEGFTILSGIHELLGDR